jgi:hypothetical protein
MWKSQGETRQLAEPSRFKAEVAALGVRYTGNFNRDGHQDGPTKHHGHQQGVRETGEMASALWHEEGRRRRGLWEQLANLSAITRFGGQESCASGLTTTGQ